MKWISIRGLIEVEEGVGLSSFRKANEESLKASRLFCTMAGKHEDVTTDYNATIEIGP